MNTAPCPACEGDGYIEEWNDDQTGVITEVCEACNGHGVIRLSCGSGQKL